MPPKVFKVYEQHESVSWFKKTMGGLCLLVFVATWICSIASPFIFVTALLHKYYLVAGAVAIISLVAYLPWKKGRMSHAAHQVVAYCTPYYFRSLVLAFEGTTAPSSSDPQTFYAVHPHGAFCIGWGILFVSLKDHVRFCFSPALYASPFFRLFSRCTGTPGSAAKAAMISYMKRGESLALPPGGFEEATLTSTQKDRVFIRKRTGFIRLCLQHGIQVRPVYVFGEKSCFWNLQGMFQVRLALNRYGFPAIVPWGHPIFPLLPKSVDMCIVVGSPLVLPKIDNPTKQQVQQWHEKYIAALVKLFEDHKEAAYGPEAKGIKLEVW